MRQLDLPSLENNDAKAISSQRIISQLLKSNGNE